MIAFFSIVITVVLLGITVYGLHRYQTMEVEYTVDRSMPLPPLDDEERAETPERPATRKQDEQEAAAAQAPRLAPAKSEPLPEPRSENWLERVASLKKSGDMDQALALCEDEFPLWGAYNQACIILRTQIRNATPDSAHENALLNRLYRLAAIAELLHDKSPQSAHYTQAQLKELDLTALKELEFPYAQLGYAHLRLIRKSDIKLMQARWGKVHEHGLPREYCQDWWETFTQHIV